MLIFTFLFLLQTAIAEPVFGPLLRDRPPEEITKGIHYIRSNEDHHHLFKDSIENTGGIFIGVGTDQLYVMAGWSRPEILIPFDFDQIIVEVHHIYGMIFQMAETPEEFLAYWSVKSRSQIKDEIKKRFPKRPKKYFRIYNFARSKVEKRLKKIKRFYAKKNLPIFLSDQESYNYLANMFRQKRVHPLRGDLTRKRAMTSIANAAKAVNLPVRVVYLSNAEQYFKYKSTYRNNFYKLPFDEKSVILRTSATSPTTYRYYVQSANNFTSWLRHPRTYTVRNILRKGQLMQGQDIGYVIRDVPQPQTSH